LVDSINTPIWTAVRAHGNIKKYQIVTSFLRLSALPICVIGFKFGLSPEFAIITNLGLNIVIQSWAIYHVKKLVGLNVHRHIKESLLPCFVVTIVSLPIPILLRNIYQDFNSRIFSFFAVGIFTLFIVIVLGIKKNERNMAISFIKSKLLK